MLRPKSLALLLAVVAALLLPAGSAWALSYPVTSLGDSGIKGTLRASIEEANEDDGADSIPIEVTGAILLGSVLPLVEGDLAIAGPGAAALTIKRSVLAGNFGILDFDSGTSSLAGLTIADGDATLGAGIHNETGELTLTRVAVVGNEAAASVVEGPAQGGGIYSRGPLTLRESTVSGNRAIAEGSEAGTEGGGIFAGGALTIERSTISGNVARDVSGGGGLLSALGGGVYAKGEATIDRSTISGNSVFAEEGTGAIAAGGDRKSVV